MSVGSVHLFRNIPCNCHAGGAGLHQAAGDARTVADGVQARDGGHEALVHQQFAGVELHLNAVKQGMFFGNKEMLKSERRMSELVHINWLDI